MITCHLSNGTFGKREISDFRGLVADLEVNRQILAEAPLGAIIRILDSLGKHVLKKSDFNTVPGFSYISFWLRRENLEKICRTCYADGHYPDGFAGTGQNFAMAALPRGIVCHWIAANMPTLGFFSIVQAVLSKNGSIAKMPEEYVPLLISILGELKGVSVEYEGKTYSGEIILNAIAIVSFAGRAAETSEQFSRAADCRIIFGGSEAVSAISRLPCRDHCETIIFGPKYSFAAYDREYIESDRFGKSLEALAKDVAVFNQMACSSPHVVFFEKSRRSLDEIASLFQGAFERLPPALREQPISSGLAARIINARAMHLLSENRNCIAPKDLGWTILVSSDPGLEEPLQGKCIFIKEVESLDDVIPLVNHKIQAIAIGILDPLKRESFARQAGYRGADRIVIPGTMHDFTLPWDGILTLNRLVRWVILRNN